MKELTTARLRIAPLTAEDAPFLVEQLNDPLFLQFIGDRAVRDESDALGYLERGPWAMYAKYGFSLLRVALHDGTPIGMCGLLQRDWLDAPDIGFSFLQRHCSKGYGAEAASAVLQDAQERLGISTVLAIVQPENVASIGLLQRLGFVFQHPMRVPGEQRDIQLFRRTRVST